VKKIKQGLEKPYQEKLTECKQKIKKFWGFIENSSLLNENKKVFWEKRWDDPEAFDKIIEIAQLLAKLRAVIPTWHTSDSDSSGTHYNFEMPTIEDPSRASSALYNLARGHAILNGRNYITKEDLVVVIPVALSSTSRERVALFKHLIENKGKLNTDQFIKSAKVSRTVALKQMRMLSILELVDMSEEEAETKPITSIKLKTGFEWFVSDEFFKYWNEFDPLHTPKNCELSHIEENSQKITLREYQ